MWDSLQDNWPSLLKKSISLKKKNWRTIQMRKDLRSIAIKHNPLLDTDLKIYLYKRQWWIKLGKLDTDGEILIRKLLLI